MLVFFAYSRMSALKNVGKKIKYKKDSFVFIRLLSAEADCRENREDDFHKDWLLSESKQLSGGITSPTQTPQSRAPFP